MLARDIIDYVYTEPGGNVTLNCSNSGKMMQWLFKPKHGRDAHITISESKRICGNNCPEIRDHYEVTDSETYNLKIVNAINLTEGHYRCLANLSSDCIHCFYLLLKGKYI